MRQSAGVQRASELVHRRWTGRRSHVPPPGRNSRVATFRSLRATTSARCSSPHLAILFAADESATEEQPISSTVAPPQRVVLRCTAVSTLPVPIVQLDADLPVPAYAHEGDAGLDLYAAEATILSAGGGRALVPTGISIAIPMGYGGFVLPRSGMALKHGISVVNGPGLIDAAYRGEIKVILINTDPDTDYAIARGDRVAQLVIQKVEQIEWQIGDTLDGDDRGGGFGHSGT
ncbi:MAG: dUTP diphosphatase [Ilumatobacter sp.]|nr:dUTP diphosphatase [Ilumatobacter sp.]MBT5276528.1 dUTP diphosphatase [Ilumatobacter sp.]MBT5865584.1 dUTP diphosphatase [Ilumatobacter sp.]MBT7428491.1 dUTP diphosphatase [Ilumatobacter sp.]